MKKIVIISILSSIAFLSFNVNAQVSSNFNSNATLQSRCVLTAQNISFGNLNFITSQDTIPATGGLTVLCSKGVTYQITPDGGYRDGFIHIMRGTAGNNDGIYISLRYGVDEKWSRAVGEIINGVGDGSVNSISVGARTLASGPVKLWDAARTNDLNHQAKPDNYSTTVTAIVTY